MRPEVQPIEWRDGTLRMLDQTRLPEAAVYIETRDWRDVAEAIRRLAVRGAPLIGIAAAYGLALAARRGDDLGKAVGRLAGTRMTAANLGWALSRVLEEAEGATDYAAAIEAGAVRIHDEQVAADLRMGELGAALLPERARVLTHCNTGSLATGGIGTALGVIKTAHRQGKLAGVLVDETRPLLQGARLTAWELSAEGIPYEIIVDAAAAGLIAQGQVDAVVVGADRIAANGDVANKVGTYGLALAARTHRVPFFVVAPVSTIDTWATDGSRIPIEPRPEDEVTSLQAQRIAPEGARARNWAFDVAPAELIDAIVTERSVLRRPYGDAIASIVAHGQAVAT